MILDDYRICWAHTFIIKFLSLYVIIIWVCRKLGKTNKWFQRIRDWRGLLDRYLSREVIPEGFRWQFVLVMSGFNSKTPPSTEPAASTSTIPFGGENSHFQKTTSYIKVYGIVHRTHEITRFVSKVMAPGIGGEKCWFQLTNLK